MLGPRNCIQRVFIAVKSILQPVTKSGLNRINPIGAAMSRSQHPVIMHDHATASPDRIHLQANFSRGRDFVFRYFVFLKIYKNRARSYEGPSIVVSINSANNSSAFN